MVVVVVVVVEVEVVVVVVVVVVAVAVLVLVVVVLVVVVVVVLVAGAACGEIWNDSRSGKRCNFQWNLLLASAKSSLGGAAGCGLRFLGRIMVGCSRIMLGSVAHWKCHFSCFQ